MLDRRLPALHHGALVRGREVAVAPRGRTALRPAAGVGQHDERGHVAVLGAESVADPRAEARPAHQDRTGVHQVHRFRVRHAVAVAPAQKANVVDARADVREPVGHLDAALAVLLEGALGREQLVLVHAAARLHRAERLRQLFAVQSREFGLRVEGVHVRRPAGHEQEDDALRGRLEVRLLRRERVRRAQRASSARASSPSMAASASAPNPHPAVRRKARRSYEAGFSSIREPLSHQTRRKNFRQDHRMNRNDSEDSVLSGFCSSCDPVENSSSSVLNPGK